MITSEYIKEVFKVLNTNNVTKVAEILGVKRQELQQFRNDKTYIDSDVILKIASILKIPEEKILFDVKAQKAKTEEAKELWTTLSKKISQTQTLYIM